MKGYMQKYIGSQTILCQKNDISRVIIDLIVIQIQWRIFDILENGESNH